MSHPPARPDPQWVTALAAALGTLGSERFPTALRQMLALICPFESMLITRYRGHAAPRWLYHDLDDMQAAVSVELYSAGPYLLDPFYQACRNNIPPGAYRILDVAPKSFARSQYYRTFYRKIRVLDELALLVRLDQDDWIIVSLARTQTRARFSDAELAAMSEVFPMMAAGVVANWGEADQSPPPLSLTADRLRDFARDLLSPREADVVHLVLQGHTSRAIATFLGVAEGTVKVHRHHAYAKLGIHSQSELFSLATRYLMTTRA